MLKVGIIGATGYTGVTLVSLLLSHPDVEITLVTSNSYKGKKLSEVFPVFKGIFENILVSTDEDHRGECDVFFLGLPHGTSMKTAARLYDDKAIIIDLSADFRFENVASYENSYVKHSAKDLLLKAVFGLPELYRDKIKSSKIIGNPGCYPTSAILALYPLLRKGLLIGDIFIDSKSGVSGAGRDAKTGSLFCEVSEGFKAYSVGTHRHEPEIQKEVDKLQPLKVMFTPHLIPMNRGILSTTYCRLKNPDTTKNILQLYRETYHGEPFVRIMDEGQLPDTRFTRYSNYCDIGLKAFDDGRIIIISTIDNLLKGASGQAVQNMNIAAGIIETSGLKGIPQYP